MSRGMVKRAFFVALAGSALALAGLSRVRAAGSPPEVLAMTTGYGVEADCLDGGGECGRLVADAWCADRGLGVAAAFGPAGEAAGPSSSEYVVACTDGTAASATAMR